MPDHTNPHKSTPSDPQQTSPLLGRIVAVSIQDTTTVTVDLGPGVLPHALADVLTGRRAVVGRGGAL